MSRIWFIIAERSGKYKWLISDKMVQNNLQSLYFSFEKWYHMNMRLALKLSWPKNTFDHMIQVIT